MVDFSLLGIGACGGNQVAAFKKYKLDSYYINSAIEDIKSLNLDDIHYFHIKDAQGCHKDRNVSKQYLADNYNEILVEIDRYLQGEYVFLFGSTGGGTSSGMIALMTELLETELHKIVIPVVTIPNFSESPQAKKNAYDALRELNDCAEHTTFIVDNNKETNYVKSNNILADTLYALISDVSQSTDGIYDYSEIFSMLRAKGYGIVNFFSRKPTQIDLTPSIKNAIDNNIFASIEQRNALYYCGIKSSTTKRTVSINSNELQLAYGYWKDIFVGYQTKSDLVFLSGLSYPINIVNKLYDSIQEDTAKIKKDLELVTKVLFKPDKDIDDLFSSDEKPKQQKLSVRDRLLQMSGGK